MPNNSSPVPGNLNPVNCIGSQSLSLVAELGNPHAKVPHPRTLLAVQHHRRMNDEGSSALLCSANPCQPDICPLHPQLPIISCVPIADLFHQAARTGPQVRVDGRLAGCLQHLASPKRSKWLARHKCLTNQWRTDASQTNGEQLSGQTSLQEHRDEIRSRAMQAPACRSPFCIWCPYNSNMIT